MCVQSSEVTIAWEEAKETKKEVLQLNTVGAIHEEEEKKGSLVDETEKKVQDEEAKWIVFKYESIPPISDLITKSQRKVRTIRKLMIIPWKSLPSPLIRNLKRMPQKTV